MDDLASMPPASEARSPGTLDASLLERGRVAVAAHRDDRAKRRAALIEVCRQRRLGLGTIAPHAIIRLAERRCPGECDFPRLSRSRTLVWQNSLSGAASRGGEQRAARAPSQALLSLFHGDEPSTRSTAARALLSPGDTNESACPERHVNDNAIEKVLPSVALDGPRDATWLVPPGTRAALTTRSTATDAGRRRPSPGSRSLERPRWRATLVTVLRGGSRNARDGAS